MRRLKLLLEYNGSRYHGWQFQPHLLTIQGTVEACLSRLTNGPVRLYAAGRTDAGVHALGQVVHFDTASSLALPALIRGANSLLPADIVVRQADEVTSAFHARYSAQHKTYIYMIHNHTVPSALHAPYVWHVPQPLDLLAMREAAQALLGRHNFAAFRAAAGAARNPWRSLTRLRLTRRAARLTVELGADGFLQHMARTIVGTLVAIGRGRLPAAAMGTILQAGKRQLAGATAPAQGLFLLRVVYGPEATSATEAAAPTGYADTC